MALHNGVGLDRGGGIGVWIHNHETGRQVIMYPYTNPPIQIPAIY